jgi:hypothetical protein
MTWWIGQLGSTPAETRTFSKITTFKLEFDLLSSHNESEKIVQTKNRWQMPILQ